MHLCDAVSVGHSICPPPSFASMRGNAIPTPAEMHRFLSLDMGSVSEFASRSTVPVVGSTRKSLPFTDLSRIFLLHNSVTKGENLFGAFAVLSHTVLLGPLPLQWFAVFLLD